MNSHKTEIVMSSEKRPGTSGIRDLVFVGCLLLALTLGLLTGNVAVFMLGGLGVAFVAMAVVRYATGAG